MIDLDALEELAEAVPHVVALQPETALELIELARLGQRFKEVVDNKGRSPYFHDRVINELASKWPVMHRLIKEAQGKTE